MDWTYECDYKHSVEEILFKEFIYDNAKEIGYVIKNER